MASYTYNMAELIRKFRHYVIDGHTAPGPSIRKQATRTDSHFLGATQEGMWETITKGYEFPRMSDESLLPRIADSTEGVFYWTDDSFDAEYQFAEDEAGEPDYYLKRSEDAAKPGVRVKVQLGWSATVPAQVISDYGLWIAELVKSLEANGYDVELSLFTEHGRQVSGETKTEAIIRCKEFGETVYLRDYGAVFAPGGYRHLVFLMYSLPEENGKSISSSKGSVIPSKYGVEWDGPTRTIKVTAPGNSERVDYEKLNTQLAEVSELI